ncbi:MAG: hypothetical protein JSR44_01560 [Spirochaetes bacterium]|nr:hypothetical protein [Spirochaetota bacterium]
MKRLFRWNITLGAIALAIVTATCAPKRQQTQFALNQAAESGQTYTPDQLRAALGSANYDAMIQGVGQDNLNLLSYGIGISNMAQLLNAVTGPGKLVALMSDGPNSAKLTALDVLQFLRMLDNACQLGTPFLVYGNDTVRKMAQMVNGVTVAGMEGVKNIVHGVLANPNDVNGAPYTNAMTRLGLLVGLLNENAAPSIMATLINNIAAPSGTFSASGTAKLIRMVNNTNDFWDLFRIIDATTNINNITGVMSGLSGNVYCSLPWLHTQGTCTAGAFINGAQTPGVWTNTACSNAAYETRASCVAGGATWTADGIENMTAVINQLQHTCSNVAYTTAMTCRSNSATWSTMAEKVPTIINNITNVPNMYTIVNGLTNSGVVYAGGVPYGVDTMVATLNNIWNSGMGDANAYGLKGVLRLAYMVNQLDPTPQYGNDSDFENGGSCSDGLSETAAQCTGGGGTWTPNAGFNCTTGNFDNRLNWAFTNIGSAAAPFSGKAWGTTTAFAQGGSCSLTNDNTAAVQNTVTQSAEQVFKLTTTGAATFYTKTDTLSNGDVLRYFIDDVLQATYTNGSGGGFVLRTTSSFAAGIHRLRFDVQRLIGSTGSAYIDTVVLPGTKGAGRTAAQKTYIMMNNLYLAGSIANVATMINTVSTTVTPGGCWNAIPMSCTPTNDNGLDTLIYVVNRAGYPGSDTGTVTISQASPGVVSWAAHGLAAGDAVSFLSSGSLPAPLAVNTVYYVTSPAANSFNVSATPGGTAINTTTAGSGGILGKSIPRLALTVNNISNMTEMTNVLNGIVGANLVPQNQLVTMMDLVQTPSNVPLLINSLGAGGGAKTANILINLTAAGTSSMLRAMADYIAGGPVGSGATVSDLATMINGALTTSQIATILTNLSLSGDIFLGKSNAVPISQASPAVVSWAGHGYTEGSPIQFATTSALPAPLTNGTIYYMKNVSANSFNLSATQYGPTIATTSAGSGTHTGYATGQIHYDSPVGGVKMAQFMNQSNNVSAANGQVCNPSGASSASQFCLKNQMIRLLNDIAASPGGATSIASILSGLRADVGPSTQGASALAAAVCTAPGCTGVQRMVNVLYDLRTMDAGTCTVGAANVGYVSSSARCTAITGYCSVGTYPDATSCGVGGGSWTAGAGVWTAPVTQYTSGLMNTNTDNAGRLTAMIGDMGANGGVNTGRMINEVEAIYMTSGDSASYRVSDLIQKINRLRYLSRMLSEMNSADLMLQLLNNANTSMTTVKNLVNGQGNLAYGTNATATSLGGFSPIWQGKLAAAPANPVQDWLYYNTSNSTLYRYNAGAWAVTTSYYMDQSTTGHQPARGNAAYSSCQWADGTILPYAPGAACTAMNGVTYTGTTYGAAGSGLDTLGRLIQFINGITSGINNVVTLMAVIADTRFMGAVNGVALPNDLPTQYNPDPIATPARNYGFGMINEADQVQYLTSLLNTVYNLDLFLTIINGPGSCTGAYNSRTACIAALGAGAWTEGTMGNCSNASYTTQTSCTGGGGTWSTSLTSNVLRNSAQYTKMIALVNDVGGSTRKGTGSKSVGDVTILGNIINDLGTSGIPPVPQSLANQSRIIQMMNDAVMCGVDPAVDRSITVGPTCSISQIGNQVSCINAGGTWNTASPQILLPCNRPIGYAYSQAVDFYDPRPRISNTMLGMNTSFAMAVIVGQVTNTAKVVKVVNGFRKVNTLINIANWLPGEATATLLNSVAPSALFPGSDQVFGGLAYMSNNIDGDELVASKALVDLIFWGTTIQDGTSRNGATSSFTGVGPARMAGVLNTEIGQYLEGLLVKFGWRTVIAQMVCGLSPTGSTLNSFGGYGGAPLWTTSGTAVNTNQNNSTCADTTGAASDRCSTIPGSMNNVNFKVKEQLTTAGSCSNAAFHTQQSCTVSGYIWNSSVGSYTWLFGIKTAAQVTACTSYYPEQAVAYGDGFPLDQTVFLGGNAWLNTINAGIGGVWNVLKGSGLMGWMLTNSGSIGFPPNQPYPSSTYKCTDGSSTTDEWTCVQPGMGSGGISTYRWGNHCSIPVRNGTNCNVNYSTCESTCQGRWQPNKDFYNYPGSGYSYPNPIIGVDPTTGVDPIQ